MSTSSEAVPTTTTTTSSSSSNQPIIKTLPQCFPTYHPECKDQANAFFACFEKNAVMKDDKDTVTPKNSLSHCQDTLRAYVKCQDAEDARRYKLDNKAWWQFW